MLFIEQNYQEAILTALEIMSSFDFGQCNILNFISHNIVQMLKHEDDWEIRAATAKACSILLKQHADTLQKEQGGTLISFQINKIEYLIISNISVIGINWKFN